jgi:arylsulfatase A-like enzyme
MRKIEKTAAAVFGAGLGIFLTGFAAERADSPPNIVLILADDLGYGDLGIHGAPDIKTPHIDSLFRNGLQFKEAYVAHPTCGPSRAALLTGRHKTRIGFPTNPDHIIPAEPGNLLGLPRGELTLADLLRKEGYATALVGKWHLGHQKACHPLNRGFDEFYGFLSSLYRYFDLGNLQPPHCMMRGFERVHEKEYLTDAFARECVDFIARRQDEPFFLFASFNAPHTPLMYDDPAAPVPPLRGSDDVTENRRMLVNMTEHLDTAVGRIVDQLKQCGLSENTLIFFLSDNGGTKISGAYSNGSLRDWKGSVFEGGVRVPMVACWPGRIQPGSYSDPVSAMDIAATSVHLAGGRLPTDRVYDSLDLAPVLFDGLQDRLHKKPFFWSSLGMEAVRKGDWKLVMRGSRIEGLYNIAADPGEQNNLAEAFPERVQALRTEYKQWQESCPKPTFKPVGRERFLEWEKEQGAVDDEWK